MRRAIPTDRRNAVDGITRHPIRRPRRGGTLFLELGCMNCHVPRMAKMFAERGGPRAKGFDELDPSKGCLAESVPEASPLYAFAQGERDAIREVVASRELLLEPLAPAEELDRTLAKLQCVVCHVRDGAGGPTEATRELFVSAEEADMGDQGRYPPTLTGVGDKLRTEAIRATLDGDARVRPYLATRMPVYGAGTTARLPVLFEVADAVPAHGVEPAFSEESVEDGRLIAGTEGLGCITCHTLAGHKSLGIPAVDLAAMHKRLRPGWFRELLLQPARYQPGTRMPQFWLPNERIMPQIEGGDPRRQIDAVWNYLSLGASMPLPEGLVVEAGAYHLDPSERPILFGTFMKGVSPRTICVGFPQRLHVAYDAQANRLAKAWRGEFMDAEGTWHARAGMLEEPLRAGRRDRRGRLRRVAVAGGARVAGRRHRSRRGGRAKLRERAGRGLRHDRTSPSRAGSAASASGRREAASDVRRREPRIAPRSVPSRRRRKAHRAHVDDGRRDVPRRWRRDGLLRGRRHPGPS